MMVKHLTEESKSMFREICKRQTADPVNKETDGMILYTWLISVLENIHNYPEWFEEKP